MTSESLVVAPIQLFDIPLGVIFTSIFLLFYHPTRIPYPSPTNDQSVCVRER